MEKVKIILDKGILDVKQVLVCSICDEPVSQCEECGGIFVNKESVYCDDDGHHWHLNCKP